MYLSAADLIIFLEFLWEHKMIDDNNLLYISESSDSDDEILGVRDSSYTVSFETPKQFPTNFMGFRNPICKFPKEIKTRNICNNNKQTRNNYNHSNRYKTEESNNMPSMETINLSDKQLSIPIKNNGKYQRMREITEIIGFIVNIHDATNFDIDFGIPLELHEKYCNVISNQYTYQDLGNEIFENPDLSKLEIVPEIGITYRCRLRGVGINQLPSSTHISKNNSMTNKVKQIIDQVDGWVMCTLSDIDVYQRLLVDIIIHTNTGTINLCDYLLLKMENEDDPIFYPYTAKRNLPDL